MRPGGKIYGYVHVTAYTGEFRNTVRDVMKHTKYNTLPKVIRQAGSMIVALLIKWTPPRSKSPGSETFQFQKLIGMVAVKRDFERVFWRLRTFIPLAVGGRPSVLKEWQDAVKSGSTQTVNLLMEKLNIPNRGAIQTATEELHHQHKRQGRIPKNFSPPYHVFDSSSVASLIQVTQRRVGEWKHGWAAAAVKLKVPKIPKWIMNQMSDPGTCVDHADREKQRYIYFENRSAGTATGNANSMVQPAGAIVRYKFKKMLEGALAAEFKKASVR